MASAVTNHTRNMNRAPLLKYFACLALVHECITPKSPAQGRAQNSRDDGTAASHRGSQRSSLQLKIRNIATDAHGKVSVACALPGDEVSCDLNPNATPPMQSVFKLPLALAVLHNVEQGSLSLDQVVRFGPDDRILPSTYSPLQNRYPDANVDVTLKELLRLTVALSDNVAADILLRTVGGPKAVNDYVVSLGISGFHLEDGEHALYRNQAAQYKNWFTPAGAVQLLRRIADRPPLSPDHTALLLGWMQGSVKPRLEADLPSGPSVAHKAGTSGVDAGIAHATNDIGLITLPDGRRLAIAVFVTDSSADEATREKVISRIAREAYDASLRGIQRADGERVAPTSSFEDLAHHALHNANATGFIHVRDVSSGRVLLHVSESVEGDGEPDLAIDSPVRPLSVIKVYVAASWLEHGFGSTVLDCAPSGGHPARRMLLEDVLSSGCDSAGAEMANILRRRLGAAQMLRDLRRYGLRDVTLRPNASDTEWGRVLSLGEDELAVTPQQLSTFFSAIGQDGAKLFLKQTAQRLRTALERVVQRGTAASIKHALANTGWHIGGKTGTGPGRCGDQCDGWFAGLLSDQLHARYVILVFIRGKGLGGGLAASTAASMAEYLAVH